MPSLRPRRPSAGTGGAASPLKAKAPAGLSAWLHALRGPFSRPLLAWKAARHAASAVGRLRIAVLPRRADGPPRVGSVVRLRRRTVRDMDVEIDEDWLAGRRGFSTAWRRLGVFVDLVTDPAIPAREWEADLGDHVSCEGPLMGFCSNFTRTILVPDRGFDASRGYARQRREAATAPPFDDRDDAIVWRGSPTGRGALATPTMDPTDPALRQRIRMCLLLRRDGNSVGPDGVDARILTGSYRPADLPAAAEAAMAAISGGPVPQSSWRRRKFAIDVDGHANAFSNLFIRLVYGCCVIKVASPFGYRQWYYDDLRPWEHFIPVAADLSDLLERVDWCRRHPDGCREIAARGQSLALAMTPQRERRRSIDSMLAAAAGVSR